MIEMFNNTFKLLYGKHFRELLDFLKVFGFLKYLPHVYIKLGHDC